MKMMKMHGWPLYTQRPLGQLPRYPGHPTHATSTPLASSHVRVDAPGVGAAVPRDGGAVVLAARGCGTEQVGDNERGALTANLHTVLHI